MGQMKHYALWLEENGYTVWDELKEEYYFPSSQDPNELFRLYSLELQKERTKRAHDAKKDS